MVTKRENNVPDFSKIAVGVKTFLRDEHMYAAVKGILHNMPGAQIIVADDGRVDLYKFSVYENLKKSGHQVILLPFDSGFGKKSNFNQYSKHSSLSPDRF